MTMRGAPVLKSARWFLFVPNPGDKPGRRFKCGAGRAQTFIQLSYLISERVARIEACAEIPRFAVSGNASARA